MKIKNDEDGYFEIVYDKSITKFVEDLFWHPIFYIVIILFLPSFTMITLIYGIIEENPDWALYTLYLFPLLWLFFLTYAFWRKMQDD